MVWGMDISRDWNRVATGSDDGIAKIWDLTTQGEALALNENAGIADDVAFSPDDTRVAVSYENGTTIVWDASTGEKLLSLPGESWATSVDFSPDGKLLAVGYYTKGIVQLWNLQTGETSLTLKGHDSVVDDVVFSPDGKRLLTASADGTSKVWEVATGMELLTLYSKYLGHVFAGDFSPDGSLVVTVDWSGYGAVWDVATGSLQSELGKNVRTYNLKYYDVAFSPDGKSIATASTGGEAIIWDASTGEQLMKFACDDQECDNVEFSPDGNTLATSGIKDHCEILGSDPLSNHPPRAFLSLGRVEGGLHCTAMKQTARNPAFPTSSPPPPTSAPHPSIARSSRSGPSTAGCNPAPPAALRDQASGSRSSAAALNSTTCGRSFSIHSGGLAGRSRSPSNSTSGLFWQDAFTGFVLYCL